MTDPAIDYHADQADQADLIAWLQVTMLPGIGPRILSELLDRFETPQRILTASNQDLLSVSGVGEKLAGRIGHADQHVAAEAIIQWCQKQNVAIVMRSQSEYPRSLRELPDAPPLVFVRGEVLPCDGLAVAIVGSRHATAYGGKQAEQIAYGLARAGVTIVSGLARGIDSAAHQGALNADGRTLAVLGGGLAKFYPPENIPLAKQIVAAGAVLSEYRPDASPKAGMFPQRNRLISGLSMAVLVIEAADRSGALITARLASEQGREVLALPGNVNSRMSAGCLALIRDGAILVRHADDVLEALGPAVDSIPTNSGHTIRNGAELLLNDQERAVLEAVQTEATSIDTVIAHSGLPVQRVLATMSVLESRKLVRRLSGQFVCRV